MTGRGWLTESSLKIAVSRRLERAAIMAGSGWGQNSIAPNNPRGCHFAAPSNNVAIGVILLKNSATVKQPASPILSIRCAYVAARRSCIAGATNLASLRRFRAVAASRNSSLAPVGPRNRNRLRPMMGFRWANSISIFLRSRSDRSYSSVPTFWNSHAAWQHPLQHAVTAHQPMIECSRNM